jgi:hypothetical protein
MLDSDLAELYRVETRALVQSVKRNIERFPEDFMFQLTTEGRPKPCDHKLRSHLEFLHLAGVRAHCGAGGPRGCPACQPRARPRPVARVLCQGSAHRVVLRMAKPETGAAILQGRGGRVHGRQAD